MNSSQSMLDDLRQRANKRDVPYESLVSIIPVSYNPPLTFSTTKKWLRPNEVSGVFSSP
jgi:hypothetical protein